MNEAEVRQAALRKGVKIYALHLRTPAGKNNHGYAEQQYRSLTADANPKIADLYIPVAGGEVNAFGNTVKEIGTVFADLVHDAGNRAAGAALRRRAKRGEQVGGHRLRHADGIPRSPRPGARAAGRHRLDRRP